MAEENLKLPPRISRFVLTVGATANQNGTALFEGVTVLFLAQFFGVDLSLGQQVLVMFVCILGGIGTAGVPAGSLPVVAMILGMVGVPPEGIGLILGVDRFLDMCRTALNVTGDLVGAVVVSARRGRRLPPSAGRRPTSRPQPAATAGAPHRRQWPAPRQRGAASGNALPAPSEPSRAAMPTPSRRELANAIRFLAVDAVEAAKSGHPGMPMGMADIAEVLWNDFLRHNPNNPKWFNRDRFVLSNGHGSMLQYALLHLSGYDLPIEELKNFRQLHSQDRRPSGSERNAGRGDHHRSAGPGPGQRGRLRARREAAGAALQPPRVRRSSTTSPGCSSATAA